MSLNVSIYTQVSDERSLNRKNTLEKTTLTNLTGSMRLMNLILSSHVGLEWVPNVPTKERVAELHVVVLEDLPTGLDAHNELPMVVLEDLPTWVEVIAELHGELPLVKENSGYACMRLTHRNLLRCCAWLGLCIHTEHKDNSREHRSYVPCSLSHRSFLEYSCMRNSYTPYAHKKSSLKLGLAECSCTFGCKTLPSCYCTQCRSIQVKHIGAKEVLCCPCTIYCSTCLVLHCGQVLNIHAEHKRGDLDSSSSHVRETVKKHTTRTLEPKWLR